MADLRFDGWIVGLGTAAGWRVVVGCWPVSPYGRVADVMVETPDGHRMLLAPTGELAGFVAATYTFDEIAIVPVEVSPGVADAVGRVRVVAGGLDLDLAIGGPTRLGRLLRVVPGSLAGRLWWVALCDWPARLLLRGVRTVGSAGGGRREWYAAGDNRVVSLLSATWDAHDLGGLADVSPPVTFGFGSTPRRPSWTRVTTTVRVPPVADRG